MAAPHGRRMRRLSTDDDDESEASDGPGSPIRYVRGCMASFLRPARRSAQQTRCRPAACIAAGAQPARLLASEPAALGAVLRAPPCSAVSLSALLPALCSLHLSLPLCIPRLFIVSTTTTTTTSTTTTIITTPIIMSPRRLRSRARLTASSRSKQASAAPPARPRRGAARSSGAVAEHAPPEESRQSIHLKVKAEPSKLKKATGGRATVFAKTNVSSSNIVSGKRKRPTRYAKAGWSTSDDDSDEDEDADGMDVDEQDVDGQENADDDDDDDDDDDEDVDAEGDEDEEMEEAPPVAPRIRIKNGGPISRPAAKPVISLTGPSGSTATVKANELEDEEEELSELESELEGGDEDAEGEEVDENDHEVDSDSEDATPRSVTPDLSKMTRRQRAKVIEDTEGGLMALSNGAACTARSQRWLTRRRGPEEEAPHGRRARHAPRRDGPPAQEPQREAQ